MWPTDLLSAHAGILLLDLVGGLLVAGYVVAGVVTLVRTGSITQARLRVAEGAILGLSLKTAATLLKTLELHTWEQIGLFAVVFGLRTLLKQLFVWESGRLAGEASPPAITPTA